MLELSWEGTYLSVEGPTWYPDIIGKSIYDHGTNEAICMVNKIMTALRKGAKLAITRYTTIDGHSCRAIMFNKGDRIKVRSFDMTK